MHQTIVRVSPAQAAKIFGIIYFVGGLLLMPFFALPVLLAADKQPLSLALAVVLPILYGVFGFIGTASFCWLYNVVSARVGGIRIELSAESRP